MVCVKGTLLLEENRESLVKAADIIKQGGLVAFPTETVYGLGAAATNAEAVKSVFAAKGRPADNPLIVHLSDFDQLSLVARDISSEAKYLADRFWPGPLSLVLPRAESVPAEVSAGLPTVAVRMPDHPVALALINLAGVPVAAPSANKSGRLSPTSYRHVLEDLIGEVDAVIKSNICKIGIESTVLDLTASSPRILRPGGLSREELEKALGCAIEIAPDNQGSLHPASPGMKYRHYSPRAPLILVTGNKTKRRNLLYRLARLYQRKGFLVGLLNFSFQHRLKSDKNPEDFAAMFYSDLRRMDAAGVDIIVAEEVKLSGIGLALMNRLRKAATRVLKV
ncbi:MAG: L-threonylcarbamoyladenylate synthase [Bacillota bacterium]